MGANGNKLTLEQFISRANTIHNSKYNYSKTKYLNSRSKIIIVCPSHGEFKQKIIKGKLLE